MALFAKDAPELIMTTTFDNGLNKHFDTEFDKEQTVINVPKGISKDQLETKEQDYSIFASNFTTE